MRYVFLIVISFFIFSTAHAKTKTVTSPELDQMLQLKVYMSEFVNSYSNLESELRDNAKPNWQKSEGQLIRMKQIIFDIKQVDGKRAYHGNLSDLDNVLNRLSDKIQKKDTTVSETLDELTNTCLKCHLTHRRMDVQKVDMMKHAS